MVEDRIHLSMVTKSPHISDEPVSLAGWVGDFRF